MNAVEIEEALSDLASQPFSAAEFPFAFLTAFDNKETTIKRLRAGSGNTSDVTGGVLQRNNIHMAVCAEGLVGETLAALRASPKTAPNKVKFILATDGFWFEAEDTATDELIACEHSKFADHFGFFLPLAGISTVEQIKNNPIDVRATRHLNKLYVELLRDNPGWATAVRRHDLNQFMARLIFCFFAEDTGIFEPRQFSKTVEQMSDGQSSNTHEVIAELFRAMNTPLSTRAEEKFRPWAAAFPYVNGGLYSGDADCPRFSRIARTYLLKAGELDWREINPDIFGSMIQAVADDDERGDLGMHYTSMPNILKVLNPLFLDNLREQLEAAGDNGRALLNLRKRMSKIRVFDPACGSGNFLVIAYKEMRALEALINLRRDETDRATEILLTNFRGIELRDFPAEIARLALIIAQYQCDVLYRGRQKAVDACLPLDGLNWITCGNALRLDWFSICPSTGSNVKFATDDLFHTPFDQAQIDFENEGGETYICGNPQFKGARKQNALQKEDMSRLFYEHNDYKDCDYVVGWFIKAAEYAKLCASPFSFVATNSIAQGEQVAHLWSRLYKMGMHIHFAHRTFLWRNNAQNNAGVHCVILGIDCKAYTENVIYEGNTAKTVKSISPYLTPGEERYVVHSEIPIANDIPQMVSGNMARDGGNLILSRDEADHLVQERSESTQFIKRLVGTKEINQGQYRYCLWISDAGLECANSIVGIRNRIENVKEMRLLSTANTTRQYARSPHKFAQRCYRSEPCMAIPKTITGEDAYLSPNIYGSDVVVSDLAFVVYPLQFVAFSIISSTLHLVWAKTVAGGMRDGLRYSSQLAYHTFPVPPLTDKNKADLTRCAEDILIAREAHFPATIAYLYDPETMPENLRQAHEHNDEVLERIYIGRHFRNDTERLEKLFELYTKMTANTQNKTQKKKGAA